MKRTICLLLLCSTPAWAQDSVLADAQRCSAIEDSLTRLTCFDRAFPKDAATAAEAEGSHAASDVSPWSIDRDQSALDDSPTIVAVLTPSDTTASNFMGGAMLALRCMENTTSVIISTDMFLSGNSAPVTVRVGSASASTSQWAVSNNSRSVGLWSGSQAIPFIKSLPDNGRLAVRVEGRGGRMDATYDLGDVSNVAAEIAEACNWPVN